MSKVPFYGFISNHDCNLRCAYCFEHCKHNEVLSSENAVKFLRAAYKQDYETKTIGVSPIMEIMGGEAFLHPDILQPIIDERNALNSKYGLVVDRKVKFTTNGTLFAHDASLQVFLEKNKDCLHMTFSIDGDKTSHNKNRCGSYDDAVKGYQITRDIIGNDHCGCRSTVNHETIGSLGDSLINLFELGFRNIVCFPVDEEDWPLSEYDLIYPQFQKVVSYIMEHKLWDVKHLPILWKNLRPGRKSCNMCVGCDKKLILAPDNKLYNCVKLGTAPVPVPLGHMDGDNIVIDDTTFREKFQNIWRAYPEKCLRCGIGNICHTCTSQIYLFDPSDVSHYHRQFSKCGWTFAYYQACMDIMKTVSSF